MIAIGFGAVALLWNRIRTWQKTNSLLVLARDLTQQALGISSQREFTSLDQMGFTPPVRSAIIQKQKQCQGEDLIIGHIDAKGRILSLFGNIPHRLGATKETFIKRARNQVDIVLVGNAVLVRKDLSNNRLAFAREWFILSHLLVNSQARVPGLYKVDENNSLLYMNYIPGRMMNSIAPLFDEQRHLANQNFSEDFMVELENQYNEIHKSGIAGLDIGFGNVVEDSRTGHPTLIDYEVPRYFPNIFSFSFAKARNRDRMNINFTFGRNLLTEQKAHTELLSHRKNGTGWYAPIDFGLGLGVPGFWSIDAGTGRWEHFNRSIVAPLVKGKRILDLGSNNASMPIMMLREGAKEAFCVEQQEKFIKQGKFVVKLFEWRDMRSYELKYHQGNMLDILEGNWGYFDIISAHCSLYHLSEDDMQRVVRRAAELSPVLILQGNLHEGHPKKSGTDFLKMVLEANGFPTVDLYAPPQYARPLLIGHRGQ